MKTSKEKAQHQKKSSRLRKTMKAQKKNEIEG
jgi:hypothetical protein